MIVSVISPHNRKTGNSTTAILLGMGLADLNKPVLTSHVNNVSLAYEHYFSTATVTASLNTNTQLFSLVENNAITPNEIYNFTTKVNDSRLESFVNTSDHITEERMLKWLIFLLETDLPYDYVVLDVDTPLESEATQKVIRGSDVVIINMVADVLDAKEFKQVEKEVARLCRGKKVIVVVNKYDGESVKTKEFARLLGWKTQVLPIRYNLPLQFYANNDILPLVYTRGKRKHSDSIGLFKDINTISKAVYDACLDIRKARNKR